MTTIQINDQTTLAQINEQFHQQFPHLRLEFYTQEHHKGEGSANDFKIKDLNQSIQQVRSIHQEGHLQISGHWKVKNLEQEFAQHYGLFVQIFRKSGTVWLQTTKTDEWTLAQQEQEGDQHDHLQRIDNTYETD